MAKSTKSKSRGRLADRLLSRAEQESELRAQLVDRWAQSRYWSCLEGVALAWTVDPQKLIDSGSLSYGPKTCLPDEAKPFLELAQRGSDPEFSSNRIVPSRFIAWGLGAGIEFHPDWYEAISARGLEDQTHPERRTDLEVKRGRLIKLWARAAYWSPAEGASLAFDLDPKEAVRPSVTGYDRSRIVKSRDAGHLLELAYRATDVGILSTRAAPSEFILWARKTGVDFDAAWWSVVETDSHDDHDQSEQDTPGTPVKDLKTRERDTLLKLVAGMAKGVYGWSMDELRSTKTSEIEADLARAGVTLHPDTIRKWLRESAELLPREEP